jgi:Flp pilus assembly pilin Flp
MESEMTIPRLLRLADDSSGATAVEYALIVSAIAGLVAGVVYFLGAKTNNLYNDSAKGW